VRPLVWGAAIVALIGCGLLCGVSGGPNVGDVWSMATAITWAVYIYRIEAIASRFKALPLAVAQLVPIALLSAGWFELSPGHVTHIAWPALIVLALASTAATTFLQAAAQQVVPSPQAAVIFSLDPVFAAIFGVIFLGEWLNLREFCGAALIIFAAVLCQAPELMKERKAGASGP
jgi:drug/metabolite transporter (DMT)-like permease